MQPLAAQLPVIGDGEAVGLLLNAANEGKNRLIVVDADFLPLGRHQRPGAVPVVLDHAEYGKAESQLRQGRHRHVGMVHAAVDEQQIRRHVEALVPLLVVGEAALHNLVHGGVVVLIRQALYLEALVIAFPGAAVLKDHHAGHDVRA